MKNIVSLIALLFIVTLPASSMALPIHGDGSTCQATADDIPTDILDIIYEMIVMCITMHNDIDDINAIGVMDFFETVAMSMGAPTTGYDFASAADEFSNVPADNGDGTCPLGNMGNEDDVAAPVAEPATTILLGTGLLGLAFAGRRKSKKYKLDDSTGRST